MSMIIIKGGGGPAPAGWITSTLNENGLSIYAADLIERMVLNHAYAGVNVCSPAYLEGVEETVDALCNRMEVGPEGFKEALEDIFSILYIERDRKGKKTYNPAKEWTVESLEGVAEALDPFHSLLRKTVEKK